MEKFGKQIDRIEKFQNFSGKSNFLTLNFYKITIILNLVWITMPFRLHAECTTGANLVLNGGFENDAAGSIPSGYVLWKQDSAGTCGVDTSVGYKDIGSVKVAGVNSIAYQYTIDVLPGEKYLVESFCTQDGEGQAGMNIYWKDAAGQWNWNPGKIKKTYTPFEAGWGKAIAEVQVPAQGVAKMTVLLCMTNQVSESDVARFDNVSIKKMKDIGANLVLNGGFENDAAGSIPSGYVLWKQDSAGTCGVDTSVGYKDIGSVKVAGVNSIAYQYTIDVLPGEKYLVESFCTQDGEGQAGMNIYWKDAAGQWNWDLGKIKKTYTPFESGWGKAIAEVQVPAQGVAKMTVLLCVTNQVSESDVARFDNVSIIKEIPQYNILPLPNLPIGLSDYSLNLPEVEVRNTMRMGVFKYSNISIADAEAQIIQMRDSGFNAILTEGQRYLFVDSPEHPPLPDVLVGSLPYPELVTHTKIVADACHKYGLKVYLHLTASAVPDSFLIDYPNWMTASLINGQPSRIWGLLWSCLNNVNYTNEYYQRLDNLLSVSGADGVMVDETATLVDLCGCEWCRTKFTQDTGYIMPPIGTSWLNDLDSSLYKAFLAWRLQNFKQVNQRIKEILLTHKPAGTMLSYYALPYFEKAWAEHGTSIDVTGENVDVVGFEITANYNKYWPLFIANMKIVRAVGEHKNGKIFYCEGFYDYATIYYWWLMGLSQGAQQYWHYNEFHPSRTPLIQWEMKYENYLAGLRSYADIAVLSSTRNSNLIKNPSGFINRQNSFLAICNTLTLSQIPYKAIVDKDIQTSDLYNKAKTIIMMGVGLMSDSEAEVIRQFVINGGTLIASAETSLYDENGAQRSNFALADLFGCNFNQFINKGRTLVVNGNNPLLGNVTGEINHPDEFLAVSATGSAQVLGYLRSPGVPDLPGLLLNNYGNGKVIYFAGHPDTSLYMYELNSNSIIPRSAYGQPRDSKMVELFCNIAKNASNISTTVDNLPAGVVVETYKHSYKGAEGIQVHLLNLTGMMSKGLPEMSQISFPDIIKLLPEQPIRITVRGQGIHNAFLLSPDFDGLFEIPIQQIEGGVICELPSFARYLIIYFNQGDTDVLTTLENIPVYTGQPVNKNIQTLVGFEPHL